MRLTLTAVLLFSVFLLPAFGESQQDPPSNGWDLPDFMRNWEFGFNLGDERTPRYFADLILPLFRPDAEDRALFFEPRVSHQAGETLFNTGIGYRQMVRDRSWLLGANLFHDYETQVSHYRVGTGLEAISAYAELRANGYFGLSRARSIQDDEASAIVEKAVDGYDVEIGAPIPFYSRLKLFGGYEWYDFKKTKNREGWSARAEYRPFPFIVLDVLLTDNTKRNAGWIVNVAFRPPWGVNRPPRMASPLKLDPVMFPDSDVSDRLFTLVERHHEIVVEKYGESNGQLNVEIRRGT